MRGTKLSRRKLSSCSWTPSTPTLKSSRRRMTSAQFSRQILVSRKEQQNSTASFSWTYMAA